MIPEYKEECKTSVKSATLESKAAVVHEDDTKGLRT